MIIFSCGDYVVGVFFSGFWVFGVIGWMGFMSVYECMLFLMMILH